MVMNDNPREKFAVIGASRGLGRAVSQALVRRQPTAVQFCVARRPAEDAGEGLVNWYRADVSQHDERARLWGHLMEFSPTRIICCVGGGPYGQFGSRQWKDHLWAYEVSLLFP